MVEVEAEYACLPEGAKAPKVRDCCLCLCKSLLQITTHAMSQKRILRYGLPVQAVPWSASDCLC